jgi:hypothetical protein
MTKTQNQTKHQHFVMFLYIAQLTHLRKKHFKPFFDNGECIWLF